METLEFKSGSFMSDFKNKRIVFKKKIKKLFLNRCENCVVILEQKCFTRIELLRCHNIQIICKKELYNLLIDLSYNIQININPKYKDLANIYTCSCMDITCFSNKQLCIKYSMFMEQYHTSFYEDKIFQQRVF